jgi:cell division transport system ATP-binding protein
VYALRVSDPLIAVIRFDSVSKRYPGGREALINLSFGIGAGEMAFVTGHSGAGKTTLLRLIALIERPNRGAIEVGGRNLARVRRGGVARLRRGIGMVFQDHRLLMDRSVADNVALPLVIAGVSRDERDKRVRAALDKVGLAGREREAPAALSTGQQQRVGIARAIVGRPSLIIADEPTGNLDPQLSQEIMQLFAGFRDVGTTIVIASHDLPLLKQMKKRVIVLDHGHLIDDVPASEVA